MLSAQKAAGARDFDIGIQSRTPVFTLREILTVGLGFAVGLALLNIMVRFVRDNLAEFDCPTYWPISVFYVRDWLTWKHAMVVVAVLAFFYLAMRYLMKIRKTSTYVKAAVIVGIILLLGSNLIQGWEMAFVHPVAPPASLKDANIHDTPKRQLYHDAITVESASDFLAGFERTQSSLGLHARTHPPGAVLLFFFLSRLLGSPAAISIGIAVMSSVLSMVFLYGILKERVDDHVAGFVTVLFILIPSVQIYYAATMDAVVASCLLGALFFFLHRNVLFGVAGSIFFLALAFSLTFVAVFALPVFFGFDVFRRKNIWRSGALLAGLGLVYICVYLLADFNYLHSFRIASALENPEGFMLLREPISYVFTRLEDICEILLFLGPFLGILMLRGLRLTKNGFSDLQTLAFLAIGTLLAMFVTGAFKTGETARVCLFIFPYLLFPVAVYVQHSRITKSEELLILYLVFIQTIVMQIIGNYWW